jgi:hypothetical protein
MRTDVRLADRLVDADRHAADRVTEEREQLAGGREQRNGHDRFADHGNPIILSLFSALRHKKLFQFRLVEWLCLRLPDDGGAHALLIGAFGHYSWFTFKQDYLAFLPILSASESVVTGVFISGFAVFLPNAVAYFDQDIYFAKKPPD